MLLEATNRPIKFRFSDGTEVRLKPGEPVEIPEDRARRLLGATEGKVRVVPQPDPPAGPPMIAEPHPNPRPCYWEDREGTIRPGVVTMLGRCGDEYWVLVEDGSRWAWVRDHRLRSKAQWEAQRRSLRLPLTKSSRPAAADLVRHWLP